MNIYTDGAITHTYTSMYIGGDYFCLPEKNFELYLIGENFQEKIFVVCRDDNFIHFERKSDIHFDFPTKTKILLQF